MRIQAAMVAMVAVACGGGGDKPHLIDGNVVYPDASGTCDLLAQTGCNPGDRCTWLLDSKSPYQGHVGCAPSGGAHQGDACIYDSQTRPQFDNCGKGLVCSNMIGGNGVCKQLCDVAETAAPCDAQHACIRYPNLFPGADPSMQVGVCNVSCDPLEANDFDGPASTLTRANTCGTAPQVGCYGYPSSGALPKTTWTCEVDFNYGKSLFHRVECTTATGCLDTTQNLYLNSCNQGYLPLLVESSMVSTAICVAMCRPLDCYQGNCGTNDANHLGASPHGCNSVDARGTFNTAVNGEHCTYLWFYERDENGNFLRSPTSDTVGFCYDHSKYLYDSNNDGTADAPLPACSTLPDGFGGTGKADGAADLGCVSTAHAGLPFTGKASATPPPSLDIRPLYRPSLAPE